MARVLLILPAYFAGAALLAWVANWLAAWVWRGTASMHWAERARLLWPVRQGAALNLFLLPVGFGALQCVMDGRFSDWCVAAGVAAWFGVMFGTYALDREILPRFTFRQWLRLNTIIWSLRVGFLGLWVGGCFLMPEELNARAWLVVSGVLAIHIAVCWRYWRRLLTWTRILAPADERLLSIVATAVGNLSMSVPKTFLLDVPMANAIALPMTGELIFTTRLMEICDDAEVASICAHELAHLAESNGALFLRAMGSLVWLPILFLRPACHAYGLAGLLILPGIPVARLLARALSRRMERRADRIAKEQQDDSGVYARALEKLYRDNQLPAVNAGRHKTHPHLYDRILAAGIHPDFERPKPPETLGPVYACLWLATGILIALAATKIAEGATH